MDRNERIMQIQAVAFTLFLNNGYEATSIRKICKEAEIEAPSLYHFFESKKGLFLSIAHFLHENYKVESSQQLNNMLVSSSDGLYDFFKFSVHYTLSHLDEARFYLRYSLFCPTEIQNDVAKLLSLQQNYKSAKISFLVDSCIQQGLIYVPKEKAIRSFMKLINISTFDIVFSNWSPCEVELHNRWQTFISLQLNCTVKNNW